MRGVIVFKKKKKIHRPYLPQAGTMNSSNSLRKTCKTWMKMGDGKVSARLGKKLADGEMTVGITGEESANTVTQSR